MKTVRPAIRGTLWWLNPSMTPEQALTDIDLQREAGLDLLWLVGTQDLINSDSGRNTLEAIFSEADKRNLAVMFETHCSPDWYALWDLRKEVDLNISFMKDVWKAYGHHRSFKYWYIGHEIYLVWDDKRDYCRSLYKSIVDTARTISPECSASISPFFILDRDKILGDFRFAEPPEYTEWWVETLRETGIDLLMLQDSGEHASFTSIPEKEPFIAAYAEACKQAGTEFWMNVEIAECHVSDHHSLKEDRQKAWDQQSWRRVPFDRLKEKMELADKYADNAVSWGWDFWRSDAETSSPGLFDSFCKFNRKMN